VPLISSNCAFDALFHAFFEGNANAVDPYSQGIWRDSQLIGKRAAKFRLGAAFRPMIPKQQVAMVFGETVDTPFQAVVFQFDAIRIRGGRRQWLGKFSPEVFEVDLVGNTEEITGAIAAKIFFDLLELMGHPIDCFVREVFGFNARATGEDFDQAAADFFVFQCGLFPVGIKPGE